MRPLSWHGRRDHAMRGRQDFMQIDVRLGLVYGTECAPPCIPELRPCMPAVHPAVVDACCKSAVLKVGT
jgi:hypothetical protein